MPGTAASAGGASDPARQRTPGADDLPASRAWVWSLVTVAAGLLLTWAVLRTLGRADDEAAEERFEESADQFAGVIERQIGDYFDELADIGAFRTALPAATSEQFEEFVRSTRMFERLPPLNGVVLLAVVAPEALGDHLAERRRDDPDYERLELGPTPEGRPHLLLTHYVPGETDLQLPVGVDISAITTISDAIDGATREGTVVTGSFQDDPLLEEFRGSLDYPLMDELLGMDFFVGVPVPEDRPAGQDPVAWVAAPVDDFDRVLAGATEDLPTDLGASLTVELIGPAGTSADAVSRVAHRVGTAGPRAAARYEVTREFRIDGVAWSATVWSDEPAHGWRAEVVVVGGLLITLLTALLVYARSRSFDRDRSYASVLVEQGQFRRAVLDSVAEPMVVVDPAGVVVDTNPAWHELRSAQPPAGPGGDLGRLYLDAIGEQARGGLAALASAFERLGDDGSPAVPTAPVQVDLPIDTADGPRWFTVRIARLRGARGGAVVVHNDITGRKQAEAALEQRATHDDLTGLLNRPAIEAELERAWRVARHRGDRVGVLFVDLDGFKPVNDDHGHAVGDAVLRTVAQRIAGAVRAGDRVARLGGDEFLVLLGALEGTEGAQRTAERVIEALAMPVAVVDRLLPVRASVGVAVVEAPAEESPAGLIALADRAMYEAKRAGGGTYRLATPGDGAPGGGGEEGT